MTVVRFPPLPAIPPPPRFPIDPRQHVRNGVIAGIAAALVGESNLTFSDTVDGYAASSVDLGALQSMLGRLVAAFDLDQLRSRWDEDVRDALQHAIITWVQRPKFVQMTLEECGVSVRLQTQDDLGYYWYEFEVVLGRGGGA